MCDDRLFLCLHRFRRFDRYQCYQCYQCYRRYRRFRRFRRFGSFHRDPAPSSRPTRRACAPRIAKSNALHRDI